MKKLLSIFLIAALLISSCARKQSQQKQETSNKEERVHPEWAKNTVIYEVNLRQYTKDGTIKAFLAHLPRLKKMGVDILWLMPMHPIGEKNRKGNLGSYYAVKDYLDINPEFGTKADFKELVEKAHEMGMYVLLDWVANHTAWDNAWISKNPKWYTKDSLGNIVSPFDWSDVADLDYEQKDLRDEMTKALEYWVREYGIDGYRCDVAGMVPTNFWDSVKVALDKIKPVFMLAEAEQTDLHKKAFNMTYGWNMHHIMNKVAKGEKNAQDLINYFKEDKEQYGTNDIRMYFTSNHDENSWNGTVFERMGKAHKAMAVFSYIIPGMPLIYSGQEAALNKRLKFFTKDPIKWGDYKYEDFYTQLNQLKKENKALWNGNWGGEVHLDTLNRNKNTFIIGREKEGNKVLALFNFSNKEIKTSIHLKGFYGNYTDLFSLKTKEITEKQEINLEPFGYMILTNKK